MAPEGFRIEPLGPRHDRAAFSCGVEPLDRYFHQQAGQDVSRKLAAVYVLHDTATARVAGYYTLSAISIEPASLPEEVARRLGRYPVFPAILLGRLAVDRRYRGRRLGQLLLLDALHRSLRLSTEIGAMAVVVDAKDDAARAFSEHHQFQRFQDDASRLFLPMRTIAQLF